MKHLSYVKQNYKVYDELVSCKLTGSLSPSDQGLAQVADVKHGWCLDIIPILLGKRVHTAKLRGFHLSVQLYKRDWLGRVFAIEHAGKHIVIGN